MKAKEIIDKVINTIEIATAPVGAICLVWGVDVTAYVAGAAGIIVSILQYAKLFIKE